MRKIKFRAKLRGNLTARKWVYGSLLNVQEPQIVYGDNVNNFSWITPETVGQFTGLTDIEGKEIYEGDIAEDENSIRRIIQYYDGCFKFHSEPLSNYLVDRFNTVRKLSLKVIGNIHDNPELVGESI